MSLEKRKKQKVTKKERKKEKEKREKVKNKDAYDRGNGIPCLPNR
jgi:hypothetical protein